MRATVLTGKQGPAFSDRPSGTFVSVAVEDGSVASMRVVNWPLVERGDALRAALELLERVYREELWSADEDHPDWCPCDRCFC